MSHVSSSGIGGFIGLEPTSRTDGPWHGDAVALYTGRAAFRRILETVRPTLVHLPSYVCQVLLEPLRDLQVPWRNYVVDETLSAAAAPDPGPRELLLVVNYFGLQDQPGRSLAAAHGARLVIDNSQAFYRRGSGRAWAFNSARKFFGVPDGAYLYAPQPVERPGARATHVGMRHLELSAAGELDRARREFLEHERNLDDSLLAMSECSERMLARIDYRRAAVRRRANYAFLHESLGQLNGLRLPAVVEGVPLCYPLLPQAMLDRTALHRRGIFVPTYWPELLDGPGPEAELANRLLPLPIDQRYDLSQMAVVAGAVRELLTG